MSHRRFSYLLPLVGLLSLAVTARTASAAPGAPDPGFGSSGMVRTDLYGNDGRSLHTPHALVLQSDGRLVAVGDSAPDGVRALRYDSQGILDPSFGVDGVATADIRVDGTEYAAAAIVQPDGKVVAAGTAYSPGPLQYALVRFQGDGTLDPSFGAGGIATVSFPNDGGLIFALARQPDGKLVAAGSPGYTVARFQSDGTLDASFGSGGVAQTSVLPTRCCNEARAIALQPDGKIVVAGLAAFFGTEDFGIVRFESDGSLDTSFGDAGHVVIDLGGHDSPFAVAIQSDSKILVGGKSGRTFALVRLQSDGSLDPSFGVDGRALTLRDEPTVWGGNRIAALTLQPDGKIIAAGEGFTFDVGRFSYDYAILRYLPDGALDTTFGFDGLSLLGRYPQVEAAVAVVLQPDAKIAVAGKSGGLLGSGGFGLARVMGGELARCSPQPVAGCAAAAPAGATLAIRDASQDKRDRITWRWSTASAMALGDFGDPTATDDYALCLYDESSTTPALRFEAAAPGGVACSHRLPCWQRSPRRFSYRDPIRLPDGIDSVALQGSGAGKAKAAVVARGAELGRAPLGFPPLPLPLPARVQLQGSQGTCVEAIYSASGVRRNEGARFTGTSD